jgi:transmembrane sensor
MPGRSSPNRTAAQWIARLNAEDWSADDEAAFRRWLAAEPANAASFERATDLWELVPGTTPHRAPVTRRRAIAGIAAVAATAAGGVVAFQSAYAATPYRTAIGEQRRIALKDGSAMLLDTDTSVRVAATPERRRLWLERGRLQLTVAPLATPFTIDAGSGVMTAGAGRFDLSRDARDRVAMTAVEGRAMVGTDGTMRTLTNGERLNDGAIDRPDLTAMQAWTTGRAAFHEDTLAAVANEANRYSETRLLIADPAVAGLRVSGMYRMGDNVALGRSLATLLSLRVRSANGAVLLGR